MLQPRAVDAPTWSGSASSSLFEPRRRVAVYEPPADHGRDRLQALDLLLGNREDIGRKDDEVGELAALDRALRVLLEGEPRVVDGEDAERLFPGDTLVGAVDAVRNRLARDEVVHRPERVVGNHR